MTNEVRNFLETKRRVWILAGCFFFFFLVFAPFFHNHHDDPFHFNTHDNCPVTVWERTSAVTPIIFALCLVSFVLFGQVLFSNPIIFSDEAFRPSSPRAPPVVSLI